jgi:hypothetical protein
VPIIRSVAAEPCKHYRFGGVLRGDPICRSCSHPRRNHYNNPRGPQIAERQVVTEEELDDIRRIPYDIFGETVHMVTSNLMRKVGYDHNIKISIKKLNPEHPEAPGYEVVAKMRLP